MKMPQNSVMSLKNILKLLLIVSIVLNLKANISDRVLLYDNELNGIEKPFFEDLSDGKLDKYTYYDAALVASLVVDENTHKQYLNSLLSIRDKMLSDLKSVRNESEEVRAKTLLSWLHENVLKKYNLSSTMLDNIITDGSFNCLSSSVLYALLALELDIDVYAVSVTQHAFCVVKTERKEIDVETTVKYGFEPGKDTVIGNSVISVPRSSYGNRQKLSILQLIALLYSNRISLLQETVYNYREDLHKYKKGYYFDQSSPLFRENLIACFNNIAREYLNEGEYEKADFYIKQGRMFEPKEEAWDILSIKKYTDKAKEKAKEEKWDEAVAITEEAHKEIPSSKTIANNLAYFYNAWGLSYMSKNEYQKAALIFENALKNIGNDKDILENLKGVYYNPLVPLFNEGNYEEVIKDAKHALKRFPSDKTFIDLISASYQNMRTVIYNEAVETYNRAVKNGDKSLFKEVVSLCDKALEMGKDESKVLEKEIASLKLKAIEKTK